RFPPGSGRARMAGWQGLRGRAGPVDAVGAVRILQCQVEAVGATRDDQFGAIFPGYPRQLRVRQIMVSRLQLRSCRKARLLQLDPARHIDQPGMPLRNGRPGEWEESE